MIAGNSQRFAIEAQPKEPDQGWVLGRFRFWLGGVPVGNWEDAADLRGCVRWLEDFANKPRNRLEPRLEGLTAADLIRILWDEFMTTPYRPGCPPDGIPDIYSRFHISHLGMSSFDALDLLLVSTLDGRERCVWRNARNGEIGECELAHGEMETVAVEFCRQFRARFG
jgi:hypothetical protein